MAPRPGTACRRKESGTSKVVSTLAEHATECAKAAKCEAGDCATSGRLADVRKDFDRGISLQEMHPSQLWCALPLLVQRTCPNVYCRCRRTSVRKVVCASNGVIYLVVYCRGPRIFGRDEACAREWHDVGRDTSIVTLMKLLLTQVGELPKPSCLRRLRKQQAAGNASIPQRPFTRP